MNALTIVGYQGGPEPDGFTITIAGDGVRTEAFVDVAELRRFWASTGEALKSYDEMAGEPSSKDAA